ncbi:MAG: PQQ-binding-like beta-propeller repeat protein [Henriciella sp.]|nr:PQQ-binding-like beta-propeller repeat protein [Henriciella sp.]
MKIWKVVLVLLAIGAGFFAYKFFVGSDRPHNPRVFDPPAKTAWEPVGARTAGLHDYDIIPQPETFSAIHVGVNNSDSVWVAAAPMFELDWVAEPAYFVGNGPTLDNEGNLYFNPSLYHGERVIMVSLDAVTGERRWAIPAEHDREKTSPAFLLNDPDNPGSQIIYISSYTRIMAIRPDGSTVWTAKTGYTLPPIKPDEMSPTIMHLNYHLQTDSLVTLTSAGKLMAFDRKTGAPRSAGGQIPGAPAISGTGRQIPKRMLKRTDALMDEAFGKTETGRSMFSSIVNYIYGGGGVVTNFFSIAPDTGLIYVAATAEDAEDGTEDGRSEIGAIYVMDLITNEDGGLDFEIVNKATFQGGTGSTPAVSADGSRVYVSDNIGHVIALDAQLNEIWRADVGEPLVGSVTVAPDNMEIYAVTQKDVFQLIDRGDRGEVMWAAELGGFDGYANVDVQSNVLTATPTANGVVIGIGGGKNFFTANMMLHVGMGLVDRKTGALRYFAEGREDSIAMSIVGPDGSIYIGHSPIRRAVGKAMYPNLTPDLTGGVARYKPIRLDLLARDAVCAAEARSANASTLDANTDAVAIANDVRQIQVLINQAEGAISIAVNDGDLTAEEAATLRTHLSVSMKNLAGETLTQTTPHLAAACAMFD